MIAEDTYCIKSVIFLVPPLIFFVKKILVCFVKAARFRKRVSHVVLKLSKLLLQQLLK